MRNQFKTAESAIDFLRSERLSPNQIQEQARELNSFALHIIKTKGALVATAPKQYNAGSSFFPDYKKGIFFWRGTEPVEIDGDFFALINQPHDPRYETYHSDASRLIATYDAAPNYLLDDTGIHTFALFGGFEATTQVSRVRIPDGRHLAAVGKILTRLDDNLNPVSDELLGDYTLPHFYPIEHSASQIGSYVLNLRTAESIPYLNPAELAVN